VPDERVLEDAFHARRRGNHRDALERFLTVFQRDPSNPFVLIEAAHCEGFQLAFPAMRMLMAEAADRAEGDALVFQMIGDAWLAHHFPEEALAAYDQGRALDPEDPELLAHQLAALERANRLPEAQTILDGLPSAVRQLPALLPIRITITRRQGRFAQAAEWAGRVLAQPKLSPFVQAQMELELARAMDGAQQPDEAWRHLLRAKAILATHPEGEFERRLFPKHLSFLARIESALSRDHVETWNRQAAALPRRRIAFLLGHPRSGTTVMERLLDAHPDIAAASEYPVFERCMVELFTPHPGVEPDFLAEPSPGFDAGSVRRRYWDLMEGALAQPIGTRLLLDKNPALTDGLHGILRFFPEARFLVMLRDPRDVLLSCLFQDFGWTRLGVACHSLAGAVAAWEATMRHWVCLRALLPPAQWLEVRYEEFVAHPEDAMPGIFTFLGCARSATPASEALEAETFIRTPTYHQLGTKVRTNAVGRWRAYAAHFAPFRERLAPLMEQLGYAW